MKRRSPPAAGPNNADMMLLDFLLFRSRRKNSTGFGNLRIPFCRSSHLEGLREVPDQRWMIHWYP